MRHQGIYCFISCTTCFVSLETLRICIVYCPGIALFCSIYVSLFLFLIVSANFYWSLLTLTANKKSSDYPEQLRCVFKYYIALYGEKNHKLHVMGFLRIFCTGKGTEITFNDQTSNYRNQRYIGFQFPGQRVKIKIILFSIMTLFIN